MKAEGEGAGSDTRAAARYHGLVALDAGTDETFLDLGGGQQSAGFRIGERVIGEVVAARNVTRAQTWPWLRRRSGKARRGARIDHLLLQLGNVGQHLGAIAHQRLVELRGESRGSRPWHQGR